MWYEFGNFRLDATRRLLLDKSGASIPLASKAVETLLYLVERRAAVVEKAELMSAVWPNVVVEENNLNQIISVLRRTLGESPGENRFIVTHPGRGYRFVADVKTVTSVSEAEPASTSMDHTVDRRRSSRTRNTLSIASIVVVTLLALIAVGAAMWRDANRKQEQRAAAIEAAAELLSKDQYGAAYMLALPWVKDAGADQRKLSELWQQIVSPLRPLVSETGATVYFKSYADVTGEWLLAGVTPFEKPIDAPRGVLRLKVEKPGFRTGYFVITNPGPSLQDESPDTVTALPITKIPLPLVALQPTDAIAIPDDMVLVPRMTLPASQPGWPVGAPENIRFEMPAFAIARSEVSNQEYKEFVDAGGYDNEVYWQGLSFIEKGKPLSFAEARKRFVDTTDRPGPAGWQLSTYRSGEAGLPVGGISWYEAMAYARFRGRTLPTVHHWARAAVSSYGGFFNCAPAIIALSRFSADGPAAASEEVGLGPWGTINMFGNVREWALNFAGDKALAVGGGWSDYAGFSYAAQPMQRLPQFGVRLMHSLPGTEIRKELLQPIQLGYESTDGIQIKREPVSDEAFAAMRFQFVPTHAKPISKSVEVAKETALWTAEEVILKFANGETSTLYIVLPKNQQRPLQPIVFGPPSDCCLLKRSNREVLDQLQLAGFVVSGGRALVLPIWAGSYERKVPTDLNTSEVADLQRRAAARWYQDISITIDYLETRQDIDTKRAGFFGVSFGANSLAPIALAIDGRFKTAVLASGGIQLASPPHPMIDIINYAPRITMPVLMINGRYDTLFPHQQSQLRLFNLLGAPANQKSHIVYDVGHLEFPPNTLARDASNWFDLKLDEVR